MALIKGERGRGEGGRRRETEGKGRRKHVLKEK